MPSRKLRVDRRKRTAGTACGFWGAAMSSDFGFPAAALGVASGWRSAARRQVLGWLLRVGWRGGGGITFPTGNSGHSAACIAGHSRP